MSAILARLMVTAVAAGQGITPLFVDLNRTHATNPLWTGHARLHVVEQALSMTLLALIEIALLWWIAPASPWVFFLATLLTAVPMFSFLLATFARGMYSGTLHDPNGVHPLRVAVGRNISEVDLNLILVIVGVVALVIAALIF